MIVIKENERLYATSWQYNSARILTRLAQLITAQGGKVKPLYPAVISDRNLEEACTTTQRRIESAAGAILSLLLAAPLSAIRHDIKRTRIPNTYDSGYHFENIPVKERLLKIDF